MPKDWLSGDERRDTLGRIHFKYLASDGELRSLMANFHLLEAPCCLLVVDDFFSLFRGGSPKPQVLAKTLALMHHACTHATAILNRGAAASDEAALMSMLLISDTVGGNQAPRQLYIIERWIKTILNLETSGADSNGVVRYEIRPQQDGTEPG